MSESAELVAESPYAPEASGRIAVSIDRRHVEEKARWARGDAMTNAERAETVRTNECPYCGCDGFNEWGTVPVSNGLAWNDGELIEDGCGGETAWDAYDVSSVTCRNYCGAEWKTVDDLVAGLPRLQPPDPPRVRP